MSDKTDKAEKLQEKLEDMEVATGQVDTPEPEDKKAPKHKGRPKKDDEDDEKKEEEAHAALPDQVFHDRLKATFKRTKE